MATYALTVSTNALGLGVISGATVRVEKRRIAIADTYPPINNLIQIAQATNSSGIATFLLEPDDLTTYHVAKIFDTAGIFIYERFFSMPPSATSLDNTVTGVLFGNSNIQFKDEGNNRGTPSSVRNVDFVGAGVEATFEGDTLRVFVQAGSQGFVAITDITPTNPSDNVGSKIKTDDNNVLQSCISSTPNITVSVLAVTAGQSFKPSVTVNGVAATLSRNALTDVWTGAAIISLTGEAPYTVTATHNEGATDTAIVEMEALPVVTNMQFSGAYPAISQTEHAQGQTVSLTITSDTPFTELEIVDDAGTATEALNLSFAATTTKTVTVTVADRGSYGTGAPIIVPAKARIKSENGTWGNYFNSNDFGGTNGVHILALNNTRPLVTINSIVYPVGQSALKGTEQATVAATYSNVDTVLWTSASQLTVTNPTNKTDVVVNRLAGGYNINTTNLTATAQRTANATSSTTNVVVKIADTPAVITKTLPAPRLRSGVTAQNHVITLGSDQQLTSIAMNAPVGTFSGSWATTNNGITNTRTLSVADSDPKGTATFTGLLATNLAGRETTAVTTNLEYVLGGFVARTVTMGSFNPDGNRQVDILTNVAIASLVSVINESKAGVSMSYGNSLTDAVNSFAIVDAAGALAPTGRFMYNRDELNARSNLLGEAQFTIEESVS